MKTQTTASQFLLLGRGTHWDKGLSPEEIQKLLGRAHVWFDQLIEQGKAKGGQRLAHEGKIVSGKKERTVTDGLSQSPRKPSPAISSSWWITLMKRWRSPKGGPFWR
jgi:hypothetical protein